MPKQPRFDRSRIRLRDLKERGSDLTIPSCRPLVAPAVPYAHAELPELIEAIRTARAHARPVIAMLGGHPIKLGLSRYLVDLLERGWITHLATNGSALIHDFELALAGETSEDVARWIETGQFGLWRETGRMNAIIREAAARDEGLGEALGRWIEEERFPNRLLSLAAAGYRLGVPVTCHVTVGADIIHAHASCDGAALGQTSYTDFLIFARSIAALEGGVYLNVGSAVTGPEVYLKALSMARNVARQEGRAIRHFTTAVFDLAPIPANWRAGAPEKSEPLYYYRPWKTILVRTVADGGSSYCFTGDHRHTIPTLWQALVDPPPDSEPDSRPAANGASP